VTLTAREKRYVKSGCWLGPKEGVLWGYGGPQWAPKATSYTPTRLVIDGVTRTIRGWAEHAGVPYSRIYARLELNWLVKAAVYLPHVPAGQRHHPRPTCRHEECWFDPTMAENCARARKGLRATPPERMRA